MKALIITDGSKSIQSIALLIKDTLSGYKTKICPAKDFVGNELLSSDLFFIGCEDTSPSSFAFLEQMLSHINLVSRKCGLFSNKEKTIKYLLSIVKDCEADTGETFLTSDEKTSKTAVKKWLKPFTK